MCDSVERCGSVTSANLKENQQLVQTFVFSEAFAARVAKHETLKKTTDVFFFYQFFFSGRLKQFSDEVKVPAHVACNITIQSRLLDLQVIKLKSKD